MYGVCLLCDVLVLLNHYWCCQAFKHFVLTCLTVPVLYMYQDGGCLNPRNCCPTAISDYDFDLYIRIFKSLFGITRN